MRRLVKILLLAIAAAVSLVISIQDRDYRRAVVIGGLLVVLTVMEAVEAWRCRMKGT